MKKLLILTVALITGLTAFAQYPAEYYNQLEAASEKYNILLADPNNDIVLPPSEQIPIIYPYGSTPSNWAKEVYDLDFSVKPVRKGLTFVIDTEAQANHEDLRFAEAKEYNAKFTNENSNGGVNHHGTHVGGILVAEKTGLLYEFAKTGDYRVAYHKALRDNGTGSFNDVADALRYIKSIAPQIMQNNTVVGVNMSLGGGGNIPVINDLIKDLVNLGVIVTCAAGNNGSSIISTPANAPKAIAVASLDADLSRSSFSNYGNGLDISAPGRNIYSTYKNNGYAGLSGTSMAAPNDHAFTMYRAMTISDYSYVEAIDYSFTADLGPVGYDTDFGYGVRSLDKGSLPDRPGDEPGRDTAITYEVPFTGEFPLWWAEDFSGPYKKFYVTGMNITYKSKEPTTKALNDIWEATQKYLTNRAFVVKEGDQLLEVAGYVGRFYTLIVGRDGYDFVVNSVTVETDKGAPLKVYPNKSNGFFADASNAGIMTYTRKPKFSNIDPHTDYEGQGIIFKPSNPYMQLTPVSEMNAIEVRQ